MKLFASEPRPGSKSPADAQSSAGPKPNDAHPADTDTHGTAQAPHPPEPPQMGRTARTAIGMWILVLSALALGHLPWAWSLAARLGSSKSAVRAYWLGQAFTPAEKHDPPVNSDLDCGHRKRRHTGANILSSAGLQPAGERMGVVVCDPPLHRRSNWSQADQRR